MWIHAVLAILAATSPKPPSPAAQDRAPQAAIEVKDLGSGPPQGPATGGVIGVEVRQGRNLMWQGRLAMAAQGSASYNIQTEESVACAADTDGRTGSRTVSNSLRVNLNSNGPNSGPHADYVSVNLEWTRPYGERPSPDQPCASGEVGSLTASLRTRVKLPPGKPVTLTGDAGLAITLTRP